MFLSYVKKSKEGEFLSRTAQMPAVESASATTIELAVLMPQAKSQSENEDIVLLAEDLSLELTAPKTAAVDKDRVKHRSKSSRRSSLQPLNSDDVDLDRTGERHHSKSSSSRQRRVTLSPSRIRVAIEAALEPAPMPADIAIPTTVSVEEPIVDFKLDTDLQVAQEEESVPEGTMISSPHECNEEKRDLDDLIYQDCVYGTIAVVSAEIPPEINTENYLKYNEVTSEILEVPVSSVISEELHISSETDIESLSVYIESEANNLITEDELSSSTSCIADVVELSHSNSDDTNNTNPKENARERLRLRFEIARWKFTWELASIDAADAGKRRLIESL